MTRFLLLLPLAACTLEGGEQACSTLAAASVGVTATDMDGNALTDATATWSLDGVEQGDCEAMGTGSLICGWEAAGEIEVTVSADGYVPASKSVTIEKDASGCHVVQQNLELQLEEEAVCTDDVRPSAYVTVVGSNGEELFDVAVSWGLPSADMEAIPCEESQGIWSCGEEHAGEMEIYGTASGHTTDLELINVPMTADNCHVDTRTVELVVEWLPD